MFVGRYHQAEGQEPWKFGQLGGAVDCLLAPPVAGKSVVSRSRMCLSEKNTAPSA